MSGLFSENDTSEHLRSVFSILFGFLRVLRSGNRAKADSRGFGLQSPAADGSPNGWGTVALVGIWVFLQIWDLIILWLDAVNGFSLASKKGSRHFEKPPYRGKER